VQLKTDGDVGGIGGMARYRVPETLSGTTRFMPGK